MPKFRSKTEILVSHCTRKNTKKKKTIEERKYCGMSPLTVSPSERESDYRSPSAIPLQVAKLNLYKGPTQSRQSTMKYFTLLSLYVQLVFLPLSLFYANSASFTLLFASSLLCVLYRYIHIYNKMHLGVTSLVMLYTFVIDGEGKKHVYVYHVIYLR